MTLLTVTLALLAGQSPACTPTPCPKPNAAQQFPYPGEAPESKTPGASPPDRNSARDRFPYPGETPEAPAAAPPAESSSSSSNAPTPDPDRPVIKDEGTAGTTRRERRRLRPPAQKILSDQERVDEDLSVSHFYLQSGNLPGAYLRAKDAIRLQPQTPEAHYALAEAAQKMNKREEAVAEYTKYLELDPDADQAKAARKSLEKLKP